MFDIGFWEVVLLFVVALIVVGPERLPRLARTAGFWIGKARRIVSEVRSEVERELQMDEITSSLKRQDALKEMKQLSDRVKAINSDIQTEVNNAARLNPDRAANPIEPLSKPSDDHSSAASHDSPVK
jgi:sec-independent protein translocase protein TatB